MALSYAFGITESVLRFPALMGSVALAQQIGATWFRADIAWSTIDPTLGNGGPYPAGYSTAAAASINALKIQCTNHGLSLLVVVAQGAGGGTFPVGSTPAQYAAMMAWLVAQCPGLHWEILNEADNGTSIGTYVSILQASYPAMKAADPTCTVVGIVLSTIDQGVGSGYAWMQGVYADGGKGYYDVVSVHTYDNTAPYAPNYDGGAQQIPLLIAFQALMATNSDPAPLWITEMGWNADSPTTGGVTQAEQAWLYATYMIDLEALGIPVVMNYDMSDANAPAWGLVANYNQPKPVFGIIQGLLKNSAVPYGLAYVA